MSSSLKSIVNNFDMNFINSQINELKKINADDGDHELNDCVDNLIKPNTDKALISSKLRQLKNVILGRYNAFKSKEYVQEADSISAQIPGLLEPSNEPLHDFSTSPFKNGITTTATVTKSEPSTRSGSNLLPGLESPYGGNGLPAYTSSDETFLEKIMSKFIDIKDNAGIGTIVLFAAGCVLILFVTSKIIKRFKSSESYDNVDQYFRTQLKENTLGENVRLLQEVSFSPSYILVKGYNLVIHMIGMMKSIILPRSSIGKFLRSVLLGFLVALLLVAHLVK